MSGADFIKPLAGQPAAQTQQTQAQTPTQKEKARATAEEFEAFFLAQLLDTMSAGLKSDGPFGGGQAEETWRSMLNQEYGKVIAKRGGIGLADAVYREMLKLQEIKE